MSTRLIVLKFGDMVEMYVKFCTRVSKFKILDSKAGLHALLTKHCQNLSGLFLTNHSKDCSEIQSKKKNLVLVNLS